jgi:RHS repeat-associated protein/uncharacterized repeat protein (TIGR01451 family)
MFVCFGGAQIKRQIEVIFRLVLIASFLLNAGIPSLEVLAAQPDGPKPAASSQTNASAQAKPNQTLIYYQPPASSPVKSQPAASNPNPIVHPPDFSITAQPAVVNLNDTLTLTITFKNSGQVAQTGLVFLDDLEKGLEFVPDPQSPVTYDSQKRKITYAIDYLEAGETLTFAYKVKLTAKQAKTKQGEIRIHTVELTYASGAKAKARVALGVSTDLAATSDSLAAVMPEGGWHQLGKVSVYLQKNALDPNTILAASPSAAPKGRGPQLQFKLDMLSSAALAKDAQGNLAEQQVDLVSDSTQVFAEPATLNFDLTGSLDLAAIPAGQEVYVATYDEDNQVWVKVPILAKDPENDTVSVEAAHFSTWGVGLGSSLPQNGANVLLFNQPFVSAFTGAAQYSLPVWVPQGRNGMTPSLSLSYSSQTYNGVLGDIQAPWVGGGWNLDGVEIVRKITTSDTGYGYVNSYSLTINGTMYQLVQDTLHPSRYYTDRNAFLYIERHNLALNNAGAVSNATGEWWEVVTTDGTRYRLGWNTDAEQLALMYGYGCTTGNPCMTPNGPYASLGYAGKATNLVALRWRADQVTDPHGNQIRYTYAEEQPNPNAQTPAFNRASYLKTIAYTAHVSGLQPGYQVEFILGERATIGDNVPNAFNLWDNYDTKYLQQIKVCAGTCAQGTLVRRYDLGYHAEPVPNSQGTLTLDSLAVSGGGFSENGVSVPVTQSATIRFTYQNKDNRAVSGTALKYTYPRLLSIQNGYGGSLTYEYGNDARGTNSWYNWRVSKATVSSGLGAAVIHGYTYAGPVYTDGGIALAELVGYADVTDTTYRLDGVTKILDSQQHFGTSWPDTGYELWNQQLDAGGTVLGKTVKTYINDNTNAPFPGWNYRYLYQTDSYLKSGAALALITKSFSRHDPATGNLTVREDYQGSNLYRRQYYEYLSNFAPNVYILDKTTRAVTVDASNVISADTRYHYDGGINAAPTKGDLTLVQRLVDGSRTSDAIYSYDPYGNRTGGCVYPGYGNLNTRPVGVCQLTSVSYDPGLQTYPVQTTNALGYTATTSYLFALGLPVSVTDANGWTTSSTFDGLGRALTTTPPGLGQPGVKYTYPAPDGSGQVAAPYSLKLEILDPAPVGGPVYRQVWGIYDGLGRSLQSQVWDADSGNLLLTESAFGPQGVEKQSLPHESAGTGGVYQTPAWSQFTLSEYDALGRNVKTTAPGNLVTTTAYDGLKTTTTDANGHQTARSADAFGRMIQVQELGEGGSLYATTNYGYDTADRLVQVLDAKNNATTIQYDLLGRKTSMRDPDLGLWSYTYDALGNLASQTDARGQTLAFTYDSLNRLVLKRDQTAGLDLYSYHYGTTAGVNLGLRTSMSDPAGANAAEWSYDDYARTVTESRTINGVNRSLTTRSDWLGRPLSLAYPDSDVVSYQYNALGQAQSLASSAHAGQSLADLAYNALGQVTTLALGSAATITNTYDTGSGTYRLQNRKAVADSLALLDFSYLYDNAGNITQITDVRLGETLTYQYDPLNRLTLAQDTQAGTTLYRQSFSYDQVGNILQVDQSGVQAAVPGEQNLLISSTTRDQGFTDAAVSQRRQTTATETSTPSATATGTITLTSTPSETVTQTPLSSLTWTITATGTVTQTPMPSLTRTVTATGTVTQTPMPSPTRTVTATGTITQTPLPSLTRTVTATGTITQTPLPSLTRTATATGTVTQTLLPSLTWTTTATGTVTSTRTVTLTPSASLTRTVTATGTVTATRTITRTPTVTATPSQTRTATQSSTPTRTSTVTLTNTPNPAASLAGYWPFEETSGASVFDSSGAANHGTLTGGTRITSGASGKAISFAGASYVTIPSTAALQPTNGLTVSAWVYPTQQNDGTTYVILNKGGANQDYSLLINSNGYLQFQLNDLTPTLVRGPKLPLNTWSMVTGVYDKTNCLLKLYVNGSLTASKQVTSGTITYDGGVLSLGYTFSSWVGSLDEVRLYNRVLTDGEVATLWGSFTTPTPLPSLTPTSTPSNPTATASPLPLSANQWGTGADGNLTINSGVTFNLNAQNSNSHACADGGDGVAYSVTSLGAISANLSASPAAGCLNPGDEILLINLYNPTGSAYGSGNYEFLRVDTVQGQLVAFRSLKQKFYGPAYQSDAGIGLGTGDQKVMLIRVPNYNTVTVNGTLTGNPLNPATTTYGLVVFRVAGTLSGGGTISAKGLGFGEGPGRDGAGYGGALQSYGIEGIGSGGNHATQGAVGRQVTGVNTTIYGAPPLDQIYLGSGGGYAGWWNGNGCGPNHDSDFCQMGHGGPGGGILLIAGRNITFAGSLTADGSKGIPEEWDAGGGGSGGSIRIEGEVISLGSVTANGGPAFKVGGLGRIAVYYQTSYTPFISSPTPYLGRLGIAPTATPTPTAAASGTSNPWLGTGRDGDLVINSGVYYNLNASQSLNVQRTCPGRGDGVAYSVTGLTSTTATLDTNPAYGCLLGGDEIMLFSYYQGVNSANVGEYEFLRVGSVAGNTVTFLSTKTKFYGSSAGSDAGIGSDPRVLLVRVPNYNNVTVNGTLTGSSLIPVVFRVAGTLSGGGTISANGLGFGEGPGRDGAGYGGAPQSYGVEGIGSGGNHATQGATGRQVTWVNTTLYGAPPLDRLYHGSGGGYAGWWNGNGCGPNHDSDFCQMGHGGPGGGVILISGRNLTFAGSLTADGSKGIPEEWDAGGGGSGGSIRLEGEVISLGAVTVNGGPAFKVGGLGRIAVYYKTSFSGNFTPGYLERVGQPTATPTITRTPTLTPTASSVDSYTKALLHLDGADGSTVFTDASGKSWTASGNAQIDTAQSKFGSASGLFDGSGDYLSAPDSNDWDFSGDFTIDFWARFNSYGDYQNLLSTTTDGYANGGFWLEFGRVRGFTLFSNMTLLLEDNVTSLTGLSTGTWYHFAIIRSGTGTNNLKLYKDGVLAGQATTNVTINGGQNPLLIGKYAANVTIYPFNGWIDELRISKGIARWTTNFTPPTAPYGTPLTPTPTPTPISGQITYTYADPAHIHAVTSANSNTYTYDANGNLTRRIVSGVTWNLSYNAENRTQSLAKADGSYGVTYIYDGDGQRVGQVSILSNTATYYFAGGVYEVTATLTGTQTSVKKYYSIAGQMVAMDDGSSLQYFLTDHLGSIAAVISDRGTLLSQQRYFPFGGVRDLPGPPRVTETDFGYTGQRGLDLTGLMDYKARFYDPALGRFLQPDSIVPGAGNPQAFNRYSYVLNSPVVFNDPSGHMQGCGINGEDACVSNTPTLPVPNPNPAPSAGTGGDGRQGGEAGDFYSATVLPTVAPPPLVPQPSQNGNGMSGAESSADDETPNVTIPPTTGVIYGGNDEVGYMIAGKGSYTTYVFWNGSQKLLFIQSDISSGTQIWIQQFMLNADARASSIDTNNLARSGLVVSIIVAVGSIPVGSVNPILGGFMVVGGIGGVVVSAGNLSQSNKDIVASEQNIGAAWSNLYNSTEKR